MKTAASRETIALTLNRLPFVRWDRFVESSGGELEDAWWSVIVYGWIRRRDRHADFVTVEFSSWSDEPSYTTSSAERSAEIHRLLYGEDDPHEHNDCVRVEDEFGELVENVIRLGPSPRCPW